MTTQLELVEFLLAAHERGVSPGAPGADLSGAYLRNSNLRRADLSGSILTGANLRRADLWDARINGGTRGIADLGVTPSGRVLLYPTPDGWWMQIGCWQGAPDALRELIARDTGWPEARGAAEIARRRPYLERALTHADLIAAEQPDTVPGLAARWGTS